MMFIKLFNIAPVAYANYWAGNDNVEVPAWDTVYALRKFEIVLDENFLALNSII